MSLNVCYLVTDIFWWIFLTEAYQACSYFTDICTSIGNIWFWQRSALLAVILKNATSCIIVVSVLNTENVRVILNYSDEIYTNDELRNLFQMNSLCYLLQDRVKNDTIAKDLMSPSKKAMSAQWCNCFCYIYIVQFTLKWLHFGTYPQAPEPFQMNS